MKNSKIVVIIPSYNRKHNVIKAIKSVLAQTYIDFELLVIDDGSNDGTKQEIMDIYGSKLTYFKIINSGVSHARNFGVQKSESEYIAFLDSDDVWHPNKLDKQMNFHIKNPTISISQTQEIWIRNGNRVNQRVIHAKPSGDIFNKSLLLCTVSPSSVFMKRDVFCKSGGFDEKLVACEDYDLWLRLAVHHNFGLLDEPLLTKFGGHKDQLSTKYKAMDRFRIYSMAKLLMTSKLSITQKQSVIEVFTRKGDILISGLQKRKIDTEPFNRFFQNIVESKFSLSTFEQQSELLLNNDNYQ